MTAVAARRDAAAETILAAYAAHLSQREIPKSTFPLGAARRVCVRFGGPAGFAAAALEDQLAVSPEGRQFIDWLIVNRVIALDARYVLARRAHFGETFRRARPDTWTAFHHAASGVGFKSSTIAIQWSALAQLCAVTGAGPDTITFDQLAAGRAALVDAAAKQWAPSAGSALCSAMFSLEATLFHQGVIDTMTTTRRHNPRARTRAAKWEGISPTLTATFGEYLDQMAVSRRPSTIQRQEIYVRELARFLGELDPPVTRVADVRRPHIEAYKSAVTARPGKPLHHHSVADRLGILRNVFERLIEWDHPDAPARVPIFSGDIPLKDRPLPRFLDDAAAAKLLRAARADPDPFTRLAIETLARTGLRKSELLALQVDAVVEIGDNYWLRVPVGKLHTDRFIPLHPQLKTMLDDWIRDHRSAGVRSQLIFVDKGRPIPAQRVDLVLDRVAAAAGIGNVTPHRLRHTLATQAINRGMSLEAIAALLGHRDLSMTMVYARIADRTVADEYFSVAEKVEALYDQPRQLPADAEGSKMAQLRREMSQRMLGNGYCTRPVELDCHFETICESCTYFQTNVTFRPTLERQRDDAQSKGQTGRQNIFDGLLAGLGAEAS